MKNGMEKIAMLTRDEVESAAFWDFYFCLSCENLVEAGECDEECPECGGGPIASAASILRIMDLVVGEGG